MRTQLRAHAPKVQKSEGECAWALTAKDEGARLPPSGALLLVEGRDDSPGREPPRPEGLDRLDSPDKPALEDPPRSSSRPNPRLAIPAFFSTFGASLQVKKDQKRTGKLLSWALFSCGRRLPERARRFAAKNSKVAPIRGPHQCEVRGYANY